VKEFFEDKLKEKVEFDVKLGNIEFLTLLLNDSRWLTTEFSKVEIKEAVWQCGRNKIPSLNGYNFAFIKKFWDVMKKDIIQAIEGFQHTRNILKGCNV